MAVERGRAELTARCAAIPLGPDGLLAQRLTSLRSESLRKLTPGRFNLRFQLKTSLALAYVSAGQSQFLSG